MFAIWAQASKVPMKTLKERFKFDEKFDQFERSDISDKDFHRHMNTLLGMNISFEEFRGGWVAIYGDRNEEVCDLIPKLKKQMQVAAFTNTNRLHATVWPQRYASDLAHFDSVFSSSDMRLRKPEEAGFRHILDKLNVSPTESIFFDDFEPNIEAARQLGITSVLVDRPSRVREALLKLGWKE